MENKLCDSRSAGMVIRRGNKIVVIERRNYPQAYALPAGHLDGDDFIDAAIREAREETGINVWAITMKWEGKIDNPCKRVGGSKHWWRVYRADTWHSTWRGKLKAGDDAKKAIWMPFKDLRSLARRTEYFSKKYRISWQKVGALTRAIFGIPANPRTDPEWEKQMGLEPVWYYILRLSDLQII